MTWWSGFIGSNLARELVKLWFSDVYLILREWSNTRRINDIMDKLKIKYGTLLDENFINHCVAEINPDIIYHLAADWVLKTQRSIVDIYKNNVIWTINLVSACLKNWFEYFINTWTNFEYLAKNTPSKETDFLAPNSDYAVSKAATTLYCSYIWKNYNVPIYTFRLFCVYWPYENKTRLIPSLALSYMNNESPKLSKPDSVRDFIYIDDIIKYYINIDCIKWDFWWVLNIWSWKQYSVEDMASFMKKISGSNLDPIFWEIPVKRNESKMYKTDTKKMEQTFNIPQISILEWLNKTYSWFLKNRKLYDE